MSCKNSCFVNASVLVSPLNFKTNPRGPKRVSKMYYLCVLAIIIAYIGFFGRREKPMVFDEAYYVNEVKQRLIELQTFGPGEPDPYDRVPTPQDRYRYALRNLENFRRKEKEQ